VSLTTRLAAAIVLLVALTATLSWLVSSRLVFRPLVDQVYGAYLAEVAFVGERIERGSDIRHLERALDLQVSPVRRGVPPHWRPETVRGRSIYKPPGRRNTVVVETSRGLFQVQRDIDLDRPGRRLPMLLLLVSLAVVILATLIARQSVRPVHIATGAMHRMARGDLAHRLPERGPAELADASRAFNQLADRIAGLLRSEKQLMAGISHELRTPLTRLRLEIELLRDAGVDPARLERMEGDLEQLDDLVGEALELSRLQLGERPLEREVVALDRLVAEVLAATHLGDRPVQTELAEVVVAADPRLLGRAIANLLQNAAKYTPPGTAIHVTVARGATVTVRDHGPGVPDDELAHLFQPFYRTESGSRRAGGHGLGLMIVHQVVEQHSGRVSARNADPGLEVTLHLPPADTGLSDESPTR
jgi:signal transduction histidine kinase